MEESLLRTSWHELSPTARRNLPQSARAILTRQMLAWKDRGQVALAVPFDVLEITAKGMQWKGPHKKECPDIQPQK